MFTLTSEFETECDWFLYFIESTMNLQEFIDMSQGEGEGQVMDYKTFIKSFTSTEWLDVVIITTPVKYYWMILLCPQNFVFFMLYSSEERKWYACLITILVWCLLMQKRQRAFRKGCIKFKRASASMQWYPIFVQKESQFCRFKNYC